MNINKIIRSMDEIPRDMTEQEERIYWSTHSMSKELLDEVSFEEDETDFRKKTMIYQDAQY